MTSNEVFDRVVIDLTKHLKSLVRERQRIWQIVYQGRGVYTLILSKGNYKLHFRGTVKVDAAINIYLKNVEEEIEMLTGWVANPATIPPAALVSHYLHTKYFR
jgi:hypothetical protein